MTEIKKPFHLPRKHFIQIAGLSLFSLFTGSPPSGEYIKINPFNPKNFPEPNPEVALNSSFKIFLPGGTAGGEYLTAIREFLHNTYGEQVMIPSSISHKDSLKKDEDIETHYQNIGQEIASKAKGKNIHILAHSLGALESIDILRELLTKSKWNGQEIKLTFMAGLGFTESGLEGILDTYDRLGLMAKNVTLAEQHTAFPLPEEYYNVWPQQDPLPDVAETIFTDSPEQRKERRNWFEKQLNQLTPGQGEQTLIKLSIIDQRIKEAILNNSEELFSQAFIERQEILAPLIQLLFKGKHIPEELHQKYLKLYKETANNLAPGLQYYIALFTYLGRAFNYLNDGVDKTLSELVKLAKKRKIDVKMNFTILDRDYLIKTADIDSVKKGFKESGLSKALEGFYFLEQLAHSSVGYHPEVLGKIFEEATPTLTPTSTPTPTP